MDAAVLQELLLHSDDLTAFLGNVARMAVRDMPAGVSCGVTVERDGRSITIASSDERTLRIDEAQYSLGDGPCLHSLRTQEHVLVEDLRGDGRWPEYAESAISEGVLSSLSVPFQQHQTRGAFNVYASAPRAFGPEEQREVEAFAEQVKTAIALAARMASHADLAEQLSQAMKSRAVIDQAIGVIMGQNRCGPDEAFAILRTVSQNRNVKLRDIAVQMVTSITSQRRPPGE
ncbi:GAF and ANTAR domain-containing protein [Kineococcus xinjiangensis]|uniref:GAF and ANTAR domain-containing protein n=1 Tax=Kineococcus xinjiangensis TaxID=512762 RepID=UPI0011B091FC|nr:GAF and ANTAR domain-containing protein [Kineococcus xinjiangensis]